MNRLALGTLGVVLATNMSPSTASAIDEAHYQQAREMIEDSIAWLRTQQDPKTGGWSIPDEGPSIPAITGLVLTGMLDEPDIDASDPTVQRGTAYLLGNRQPDGSISDRILPTYNTSICLSALARINTPEAAAAIGPAQAYLKGQQWAEDSVNNGETASVDRSHPFYGGIGYGSHGRPDGSNLNFMLQGLHDSGLDCDDEAFQRAVVFLERIQMHGKINDMPYASGSQQGGFIYATGPESDQAGEGESKAGMMEETLSDGTVASRLRAYGSMTYAGFKSYIYADLDRDDPRVRHALRWIEQNYTLEENPGVGDQGMYYYLVTFSRALDAWGTSTISTAEGERDWANDLVDRLAELQQDDGSFRSVHSRWKENDPVLITAYALIALQHAID